MITGIGTDIVDVARIQHSFEQYGERFLKRVFTETEIAYCEHFGATKFLHYAARFAAKEAFSKAIHTGMRNGMSFSSVGVVNDPSGQPHLQLQGVIGETWSSYKIHLSLSHTSTVAVAMVVIEE